MTRIEQRAIETYLTPNHRNNELSHGLHAVHLPPGFVVDLSTAFNEAHLSNGQRLADVVTPSEVLDATDAYQPYLSVSGHIEQLYAGSAAKILIVDDFEPEIQSKENPFNPTSYLLDRSQTPGHNYISGALDATTAATVFLPSNEVDRRYWSAEQHNRHHAEYVETSTLTQAWSTIHSTWKKRLGVNTIRLSNKSDSTTVQMTNGIIFETPARINGPTATTTPVRLGNTLYATALLANYMPDTLQTNTTDAITGKKTPIMPVGSHCYYDITAGNMTYLVAIQKILPDRFKVIMEPQTLYSLIYDDFARSRSELLPAPGNYDALNSRLKKLGLSIDVITDMHSIASINIPNVSDSLSKFTL